MYLCQLLPPHVYSCCMCRQEHICPCKVSKHVVPQAHRIPEVLTSLNWDDTAILSPFKIKCGHYEHKAHGYSYKTGLCALVTTPDSVLTTIQALPHHTQQQRCLAAYNFLMQSPDSAYREYVLIAKELQSSNSNPSVFQIFQWFGIECALWPTLYPYTSWCESAVGSTRPKDSSKASFLVKCLSPVIDYSLHFDIVQFVFDRWMYKTVTGALNSSRGVHGSCSQYQMISALDSKPFSSDYWKWHHRYLIDAVRQYGYPSLFITISPYE